MATTTTPGKPGRGRGPINARVSLERVRNFATGTWLWCAELSYRASSGRRTKALFTDEHSPHIALLALVVWLRNGGEQQMLDGKEVDLNTPNSWVVSFKAAR